MLISFMMTTVTEHHRPPDEALIARIADGDREALGEFYQATHRALYGYAVSILKHPQDAQDVLHDSYMAVVRHASHYRAEGKPMAWLYTITRNLCMQTLRQRTKTDDRSDEAWEQLLVGRDDIPADERVMLEACMQRLSDEERQIVVLHAVAGLRHREIAAMLSMPLSTVLSKYNRSLKKLKIAIEGGDRS